MFRYALLMLAMVCTVHVEAQTQQATFAGGCFWCVEAIFERVEGVKSAVSGYTGGKENNPTYKSVSMGKTSHAEAVQITFDPSVVTYEQLLEVFFATHDPTTPNRQGPDVGPQYRSMVLYHDEKQEKAVKDYVKMLNDGDTFRRKIVTELVPYERFFKAENYHQDYYKVNPTDPYVRNVSKPKVDKFVKQFPHLLKKEYQ